MYVIDEFGDIAAFEEIEAWLDGLTEPQVRAYACQRGFKDWRTELVGELRRGVAKVMFAEATCDVLASVVEVVE